MLLDDLLKVLLDKQPGWFFQISSLILIVILIFVAIWVFKATKRYYESVDKENRIIGLLEERNTLQTEKFTQSAISVQLSVVIENTKNFIFDFKDYYDSNSDDSVTEYIQSIVESLATDIKIVVGEKHRCGFWIVDDARNKLTLINGSSAFPHGSIDNKVLDLNHSIAGRAYRKKETLFIEDVSSDADWHLSDVPSSYKSLICVPVGTWGVVTIDGKEKMNHNTVLISELYSSIIEVYLTKFFHDQLSNITVNNAAAASQE